MRICIRQVSLPPSLLTIVIALTLDYFFYFYQLNLTKYCLDTEKRKVATLCPLQSNIFFNLY